MNFNRAPQQWSFTKNESITTLEAWRQNLQYSLSLDDNSPLFLFYQSWFSKSIRNVAGILKDRNAFISLPELKYCIIIKATFLTLLRLQSSLPSLREKCKDNQCTSVCESFLERFSKTKKANKTVYKKLVWIGLDEAGMAHSESKQMDL